MCKISILFIKTIQMRAIQTFPRVILLISIMIRVLKNLKPKN